MKYAVIGTGYWGENHVRVAAELVEDGVIDDVIFCDINEDRVSRLASQYGFTYTTDTTTLSDYGVEAATIATPSPTHRSIATELLADGIDILVEKPLALTSDDAWEIVDVAERHDRTLAVGHIFRHHPALQKLKSHINRGELGQIKYLRTNRFSFRVPRRTAGVLYSLAIHDIDIYRYLMGERPDWVFCRLDKWVRDDIDETASIMVGYDETTGLINNSWQVPVFGKHRDLLVVGTKRTAYLDYLDDTEFELFDHRIRQQGDQFKAEEEGSKTYKTENEEPLRNEVEDFLEAVRLGREPRASGKLGAETIDMLELAAISDRDGRIVNLD